MQPLHVVRETGGRDALRGHGQPPEHPARPLPVDQPGAAFPRPDLSRENHQAGVTQQPGRRTVIAHARIVSQLTCRPVTKCLAGENRVDGTPLLLLPQQSPIHVALGSGSWPG